MNEDIRNLQKEQKQLCGSQHKKRKASKMTNTDTLTEDDIRVLVDAIAKVTKNILKVLNMKKENVVG